MNDTVLNIRKQQILSVIAQEPKHLSRPAFLILCYFSLTNDRSSAIRDVDEWFVDFAAPHNSRSLVFAAIKELKTYKLIDKAEALVPSPLKRGPRPTYYKVTEKGERYVQGRIDTSLLLRE